jgi:hypothetical protein
MKNKMLSNMQLKSFYLYQLEISSNKDFKEGLEINFKPQLSIKFNVKKHKNVWLFTIPFRFDIKWDKEFNYHYDSISMSMNSEFFFPEETTEEEVRKFVPYVCLANLWGIARGLLLQITGAFPGGTVLLPTINMVEAIKEALEKKTKTSRKKKSSKKVT